MRANSDYDRREFKWTHFPSAVERAPNDQRLLLYHNSTKPIAIYLERLLPNVISLRA